MRSFLTYALKQCGKTYQSDPTIPVSWIIYTMAQRFCWLLRGLIRRQEKIFIGSHVVIENGRNLKIGTYSTLDPYIQINAVAQAPVKLGSSTRIGAYSRILCTAHLSKVGVGFTLGNHSSCGEFCFFGAAGGITIGQNVIMGQYVSMHAQDHIYSHMTLPIQQQPTTEKGIIVGNDCWIGAKATLLDGAVLGQGCIVAAGAVVKGEFPDFAVIGGVPAKIIKMRHA